MDTESKDYGVDEALTMRLVELMKKTLLLIALICGATVVSTDVRADVVDDLLAGKPVTIESEPAFAPAADAGVAVPEPAVAEQAPWEVGIKHPPASELATSAYVPREEPETINLVPEPTAIGLAALALGYFLFFFRRRHFV